jgi:hypothetical protein
VEAAPLVEQHALRPLEHRRPGVQQPSQVAAINVPARPVQMLRPGRIQPGHLRRGQLEHAPSGTDGRQGPSHRRAGRRPDVIQVGQPAVQVDRVLAQPHGQRDGLAHRIQVGELDDVLAEQVVPASTPRRADRLPPERRPYFGEAAETAERADQVDVPSDTRTGVITLPRVSGRGCHSP